MDKDREEGRQEEKVLTRHKILLRLLKNRFGKIPARIKNRIETTNQTELLGAWLDQASTAQKLEDVDFTTK